MRVALVLLLVALAKSAQSQATPGSPVNNQLQAFKNSTRGPIGILTLTTGSPVRSQDLNTINTEIIFNRFLIEQLSALNRERIPTRIVHSKGTGAFGYFKVTHDVSCISNIAFMSKVGKITPVVARMGPSFAEKGAADTIRSTYAIAARFYTEEGNYDFLGTSTDTFMMKDPVLFPPVVHITSRNPKTQQLPDVNGLMDFVALRPEAFSFSLQLIGDRGIPASFRNLEVFGLHTFQVENDRREISYVRFQLTPDLGVKTLNQSEAMRIAAMNPNYSTDDLYNAIENGDYPSWTFGWQVISKRDVKKAPFDIFDVTLRWPVEQYPVQPIGKFVLDRNPENQFRDIEQLAFNPGNIPPGMQGLDKVWEARVWAYRDAHLHRLGPNFNNIKVNCPLNQVYTYTRDGSPPVRDTRGAPNYYPNSFNGPVPALDTRTRTKRTKVYTDPNPTNFAQAAEWYHALPKDSRQRLIENFANFLVATYPEIRVKVFKVLGDVDHRMRRDIENGLAKALSASATSSN